MPLSNPTHFVYCQSCGHHKDAAPLLRSLGIKPSAFKTIANRLVCESCGARNPILKEKPKPEKMVNYVATIESADRIFHRSTCGWMKNVTMVNEIRFKDRDEAIKKDYRPCLSCRP